MLRTMASGPAGPLEHLPGVRPRPHRACGNSSLTTSASSWRHADCIYKVRCPYPVARYSHADWGQEQQAEPTCHAAMREITIGRPPALPPDFLSCYPSRQRPSLSGIKELAGKGRLHTTDDDIVLLFLNPTPPPSPPPPDAPSSVGRAACLLNDEPAHLRPTAHAPLVHASLPLYGRLPP